MPRLLVRSSRAAATLAVLLPALALVSTGPAPAGAATPPPTTTDGPHLYSSTYLYTGTQQTFTVPEGVSAVQVEAVGAAGGDAAGSHGGRGAVVTGTLPVSTGQTLYLWVGGKGGSNDLAGARGWNGGGQGAQSNQAGGGGGGATDVRTCSAEVCDSRYARVLVAAGGGGAGAADVCAPGASPCPGPRGYAPGGDAGASADSIAYGSRGTATGGGAATPTEGGAGGPGTSDTTEYAGYGASGTFTTGGDSIRAGGRTSLRGGGGGGGGVYGGGAGSLVQSYGAGGGGGSSLVPAGGTLAVSDRGTAASLRISYDLGPVTEMRVRVAETNTVLVGTGADTRTIVATARTDGGARIPGLDVSFSSTDAGQSFGPVTDNGDGTYSVTLRSSTTVGTATVTARAAGTTPAGDVMGTLDVATEGYTVSVAPVSKTLVATGHDTATVVATAESTSGKKLTGLAVSFTSTDDDQTFGAVSAGGSGTYSATLTGSESAGSATVTPVVTGAGSPTLSGAEVATEGYTVTVAPVSKTLVATGHDTATVVATAESASGKKLTGLSVSFTSTDDEQTFGAVSAGGSGTYSATLTGSESAGSATVTPVVTGAGSPTLSGAEVATEGYTVTVAPVSKTLVATGHDTATVVATAESASGKKLTGLSVSFTSTDDEQTFGAVSAGGSGTYSATLTGSESAGSATVTPVVTGAGSPTLSGAEVATEAYTVTVEAPARPMVGTGWDSLTVTARVESTSGKKLTGLDLAFESTDDDQVVGPVTDLGDGRYSATLTGSTVLGAATVDAVVSGAGSPAVSAAEVLTEGYTVTVLPIPEHLLATGSATRVVVARAQSASGRAVPDLDVSFASTDSGHRFGSVSDRGDGTYSARLTGSTTPGNASISVQVAGAGAPGRVPADLVSDPYLKPTLTAVVGAAVPARNGWYRSPVTVTFTCTGSLPLTAACPEPAVLSADGSGQVVTRSVTDNLGSTASVTSTAVSIDATRPTLKVTVKGAKKKGKTYAKAPKLACQATDKLSGVASCKITTKKAKSKKGTVVRWTAVALDKAGNSTSSKGSYTIRKKGARR
jgi:hypothetical protein